MKLSIQVLTLLAVFACPAWAANYDLYFDFSGYRNVAKLLVMFFFFDNFILSLLDCIVLMKL